jgi:hypothetical protein
MANYRLSTGAIVRRCKNLFLSTGDDEKFLLLFWRSGQMGTSRRISTREMSTNTKIQWQTVKTTRTTIPNDSDETGVACYTKVEPTRFVISDHPTPTCSLPSIQTQDWSGEDTIWLWSPFPQFGWPRSILFFCCVATSLPLVHERFFLLDHSVFTENGNKAVWERISTICWLRTFEMQTNLQSKPDCVDQCHPLSYRKVAAISPSSKPLGLLNGDGLINEFLIFFSDLA